MTRLENTAVMSDRSEVDRRRRGIAWAVIAGLPLLIWAVMFVWSLVLRDMPFETDDPLTIRFISELKQSTRFFNQYNRSVRRHGRYDIHTHGLTEARLAGWEAEFGDDPRYWELLYNFSCTTMWNETHGLRPWGEGIDWYLREARRRGVVSAPLLDALIRGEETIFKEQLVREGRLQYPAKSESYLPFLQEMWRIMDEERGEAYGALRAEYELVGGDEAQVLYHLAMGAAGRGDYDRALDYIRRGNRAPRNNALNGFPFDAIAEAHGGRVTGDALLDGIVASQYERHALPQYVYIKDEIQFLIDEAVARDDVAALDELHRYACRLGSCRGGPVIQGLVGVGLVNKVREGFRLLPASATPDTTAALNRQEQQCDDFKQVYMQNIGPVAYPVVPTEWPQQVLYYGEGVLSLGQVWKMKLITDYFAPVAARQEKKRVSEIQPRLSELAEFSYRELAGLEESAGITGE